MSSTIILSSIRCAACGKAGDNLKTCISCKQVKYCNRECQILHWPKHKKLCKQHAAELARNDNKSDSNTKTNTEGIGSINISDTDIAADKKKSTTYDDEQNQLLMDAGLSDLIDIDKVDLSGLINCLTENMRENIVKMDLSDDELFQDPPPRKECPICMEPVPFHSGVCNVNYSYQACCGKVLCCGCMAVTAEEMVKGNLKELCAYCRLPIRCSNQEYMKRVKRRMKLNEAKAYFILGCAYENAKYGLPNDTIKAMELWHQAAELGSCQAHYQLGDAYHEGYYESQGIEKDIDKATYHFKLAAIGGHEAARCNLGAIEECEDIRSMARRMKHFMIAARSGYDLALKAVGSGYKDGFVTKDEYTTTLRAYQDAVAEMKSVQRTKANEYEAEMKAKYEYERSLR